MSCLQIPPPTQRKFLPQVFIGLDLGKHRDHTVVALLDRRWQIGPFDFARYDYVRRPILIVRDVVRVALNTPYTEIPSIVKNSFARYDAAYPWPVTLKYNMHLAVDAGGVGGGVMDLLIQARNRRYLQNFDIVPIYTTGGLEPGRASHGGYTVPRQDLIAALRTMVETGALILPASLPLAEDWCQELTGLRALGGAQRQHDDLAMATALAAWLAIQKLPELMDPIDPRFREQPFLYT